MSVTVELASLRLPGRPLKNVMSEAAPIFNEGFTSAIVFQQSAKRTQAGSTLIEVLVAFFILAVGLLGVVGMQTQGMRSNQDAQFGTQVNILAMDMVDRIRAYDDPDSAADNDDYDGIDTDTVYADPGCIDSGGGCAGALLVQYDAFSWRNVLSTALPGGRGLVAWDAALSKYVITVMWDADRTGATGTNCSDDTSVDLTCFVMELQL